MKVTLGTRWLLRDAAAGSRANLVVLVLTACAALLGGLHFGGAQSPAIAIAFGIAVFVSWSAICLRFVQSGLAVAVLGLSLGVASLICVRGVTSGFERELIDRMSRLHGHVLVSKYGLSFLEYEAMADELVHVSGVQAASPFAWGSAALVAVADDASSAPAARAAAAERGDIDDVAIVMVKGIVPQRAAQIPGLAEVLGAAPGILDDEIVAAKSVDSDDFGDPQGDYDQWEDPASEGKVGARTSDPAPLLPAIIGVQLGRRMHLEVGDHFRLVAAAPIVRITQQEGASEQAADASLWEVGSKEPRVREFVVVARMESGLSELDERLVVMRIDDAQALLFDRPRASGIELVLRDSTQARAFAAELERTLNADTTPARFRASSWEEYDAGMILVVRRIRGFLSIVLSLIIVVAASSMVGALIVTIRRKRREIAALATMGAAPWDVFLAFEVVGALVGMLGGAGGVVLGVVYSLALAHYDLALSPELYVLSRLPVTLRLDDALGPVVISVVVCLLATGPAGLMAARVRPMHIFAG